MQPMEKCTIPLIDINEALERLDNDMSLYMILVDAFLEDKAFQPDKLRELESQFHRNESREFLEAAQYIHRLKGAARQLSANPLAAEAQKLEDIFRGKVPAGSSGEANHTAMLVEHILDLYQQTLQELRSISS